MTAGLDDVLVIISEVMLMKNDRNNSIKKSLLLSFGFAIVLPLVIIASLIGYSMEKRSLDYSVLSVQTIISDAADKANLIFENTAYLSTAPLFNSELLNTLEFLNNNDVNYEWHTKRQQLSDNVRTLKNSSLYSINGQIAFLTMNNYVVLGGQYYKFDDYSYDDSVWIQKLLNGEKYLVWDNDISEVFKKSGTFDENAAYICFARTVKTHNRPVGIMAISLSGKAFWEKVCENEAFNKKEDKYKIFIYRDGNIVSQQDSFTYQPSDADYSQIFNIFDGAIEKTIYGMLSNSYYYISPISSINGYIVAIVDDDLIFESSRVIRTTVGIEIVLIVIFSIFILILVSTHVSKPLSKLATEIKRTDDELKPAYVNYSSIKEVNDIAESYNAAVSHIDVLIKNIEDEIEQKESAKYIALQSQITPHFLYNTLNTFKLMLDGGSNKEDISRGITALEGLLRHSYSSQNEYTTLEDELDFIDNYVEIMKLRYGSDFQYTNTISADLLDCIVPRVTLQPLVENAIIHGVREMAAGQIVVSAIRKESDVVITVFNNGKSVTKDEIDKILNRPYNKGQKITSIGITNVNNRLKLLYGDQYGIVINDRITSGFEISLVLPYSERTL